MYFNHVVNNRKRSKIAHIVEDKHFNEMIAAFFKINLLFQNFAHPRHDEWNKFLYTTQELRNQSEEDLEKKDRMRIPLYSV